jgi:two-component sensor histidine kinase
MNEDARRGCTKPSTGTVTHRQRRAKVLNQQNIVPQLVHQGSDEQVLLRELDHRINNEFASAISAVSVAAARTKNAEVKGALGAVAELLHHYANVHHALQMPEHDTLVNAAAYLRQLCLSISRSKLDYREIRLALVAEPLRLDSDRCWRLGMIVHELVSNAARHAFARSKGKIRVELALAGAFVECKVLDNGSAAASVRPGRGLKIIGELTKGLGGRFEQSFGSRGSMFVVTFPYGRTCAVVRDTRTGTAGSAEQSLDKRPRVIRS